MNLRDTLLAAAEAHCTAHGISLHKLATIVVNDGKFFARITDPVKPSGFTVRTYERFMTYFAEHPGRPLPHAGTGSLPPPEAAE